MATPEEEQREALLREAARPDPGLLAELADFVADSGKWWLIPILVALLGIALLAAFGGSSLAPLIYPLF